MRFVAVLSVFLAANAFAQDLDINGYSKVVIPRSEGDLADYNAALGAAVRDVGFEVHRSAREIPDEARPRTLYMTAGLASFSDLSIYVVIYDVATSWRSSSRPFARAMSCERLTCGRWPRPCSQTCGRA